MTIEMVNEILKIVRKESDAKFKALDEKYAEFMKDEYVDTEIDREYQAEFTELQNKYMAERKQSQT